MSDSHATNGPNTKPAPAPESVNAQIVEALRILLHNVVMAREGSVTIAHEKLFKGGDQDPEMVHVADAYVITIRR